MIDLGQWLDEEHRISRPVGEDEAEGLPRGNDLRGPAAGETACPHDEP